MEPDAVPPSAQAADATAARLDSWKEIAAYLRRDVKTVQRWERHEGLPIRRLHHGKSGTVYAYPHEIDAWVAARGQDTRPDDVEDMAFDARGHGPEATLVTGHGAVTRERHANDDAEGRLLRTRSRTPTSGRARVVVTVATILLVAAVIAAGMWAVERARRLAPSGPRAVFFVSAPPGAVFAGSVIDPEPTVSPDGSLIVFRAAERESGLQRLYLRRLDAADAQPLPGTDRAVEPFFAPDSRHVAFFSDGELRRMDLASGAITSLVPVSHPGGGAWLTTGDIVYNGGSGEGIMVLTGGAGPPRPLTSLDGNARQTRHMFPQPTPDGLEFIYFVEHHDAKHNGIWRWRRGAGAAPLMVPAPRMGRVTPSGWLIGFWTNRLVAQRLDTTATALVGSPITLPDSIDVADPRWPAPGFSLSDSGILAYWAVMRAPATRLTWFDREGHEAGVIGPPAHYPFVSLSPDDRHVAVQRIDETNGAPDLWLFELSSGAGTRLTASAVNEEDPVWSPNGRDIAFAKHTGIDGDAQLRLIRKTHPLTEHPIVAGRVGGHPTDWSRDGRVIVFQQWGDETQSDLYALPLPDGTPVALAGSRFNERHGRLSPDGRYLAYSSDVSGRFEVYVQQVTPGGAVTQVSSVGGAHPRWRRDGREVYYLSPSGLVMAVDVTTSPDLVLGRPRPLFDARPPLPLAFLDTMYDVSADGRFLVATASDTVSGSFTIVVNALAGLPR